MVYKEILIKITRERLIDISNQLEFTGLSALSKEQIINNLSRKQSIQKYDILSQLKINELRNLCIKFDLNPGGKSKQEVIGRLLGNESKIKPEPISQFNLRIVIKLN